MKPFFYILFAIAVMMFPGSGQAEITSILMYPSQCRVTQHFQLQPETQKQNQRVLFNLPGEADPDTLVVHVLTPSVTLANITWDRVNRLDKKHVAQLRAELEAAKTQLANIGAKINAINARITFWTNSKMGEMTSPTAEQLSQIASTLGQEVESLFSSRHPLENEQKEIQRKVDLLQKKLDNATGHVRTLWRVKADLTGAAAGPIDLETISTMSGCGWSPIYRFNAVPEKKTVEFTFEAQIRQGLGQNIEQVDVALATLAPRQGLIPPAVSPWVIAPRPKVQARAFKAMAPAPMADMAMEVVQSNAAGGAGVPQEDRRGASYAIWHLGKRNLIAGEDTQLLISTQNVESEFVYTVRPSAELAAFLTAKADFNKSILLPRGQAIFLVDGALVGKRPFETAQQKNDLFFGRAPSIDVKSNLVSKQSGDAGIITSKQTYRWDFAYNITNNAQHQVDVIVQEAKPQVRDENIKLTITSDPKATEAPDDPHVFLWNLSIPPGKKQTVSYAVALEAPKDMALDLGWR
ncbi:DUF4139 domain-containing protein [Desulfovibrio inopinatus]|uniref:DUF4139 domain-containing protein n=1 Tax=Desulfovibrio inopinatus TaxID=102109 RepID=UPI000425517E|nr:DUF4139 domain-containing protein [Desulfovibrio inopinatus]